MCRTRTGCMHVQDLPLCAHCSSLGRAGCAVHGACLQHACITTSLISSLTRQALYLALQAGASKWIGVATCACACLQPPCRQRLCLGCIECMYRRPCSCLAASKCAPSASYVNVPAGWCWCWQPGPLPSVYSTRASAGATSPGCRWVYVGEHVCVCGCHAFVRVHTDVCVCASLCLHKCAHMCVPP